MKSRLWMLAVGIAVLVGQAWAVPILAVPRVGAYAGFSRAVVDVPEGVTWTVEPMGAALRVTFSGVTATNATVRVSKPEIQGWVLEGAQSGAVLTLVTPQGVTNRSGFRANKLAPTEGKTGSRLMLDVSGAFADTSPLPAVAALKFEKATDRSFNVVIDPGHGGSDAGAIGLVMERTVNLDVAQRVAIRLRDVGVHVTMTREDAGTISENKRFDLSARAKRSSSADAFVSIHSNSTVSRRVNSTYGIEVYYFNPNRQKPVFPTPGAEPVADTALSEAVLIAADAPPDGSAAIDPGEPTTGMEQIAPVIATSSEPAIIVPTQVTADTAPQKFAGPVVPWTDLPSNSPERTGRSRDLAMTVLSSLLGSTAASNSGVRTDTFVVIKESLCPAILVEMGYVKHPIEGAQLRDSNYLDRVAYGIARGVIEALDNSPDPR
jgi:N-acetylmuramoyl-L-alanine amidase